MVKRYVYLVGEVRLVGTGAELCLRRADSIPEAHHRIRQHARLLFTAKPELEVVWADIYEECTVCKGVGDDIVAAVRARRAPRPCADCTGTGFLVARFFGGLSREDVMIAPQQARFEAA